MATETAAHTTRKKFGQVNSRQQGNEREYARQLCKQYCVNAESGLTILLTIANYYQSVCTGWAKLSDTTLHFCF